MEKTIQFLQTTPEQLQDAIAERVTKQFKAYLDHLTIKSSQEELLTRKEVAEMLKISLGTLHNWVKKGVLKSYGIRNRVYFKRSEVEGALVELKS